ncbi:ABC transporter ATP-binding protein, partial [Thermococci archaeon]
FEGKGQVNEYVGGYEDWLRQMPAPSKPAAKKKSAPKPSQTQAKTRKISYHEQRELAALPEQIEKLENELSALQNQISEPQFYQSDPEQINQTLAHLKNHEAALQTAYARWEELENG